MRSHAGRADTQEARHIRSSNASFANLDAGADTPASRTYLDPRFGRHSRLTLEDAARRTLDGYRSAV
jgi:hypothetical protein